MDIIFRGDSYRVIDPENVVPQVHKQDFTSEMSESPQYGPSDEPRVYKQEYSASNIVGVWGAGSGPGGCVPVFATGQDISPVKDPYNVGDVITVTPAGLQGKTPITYRWFVQGVLRSTGPSLNYTLTSADFPDPTPGSISTFNIDLFLENECGPGTLQISADYHGQQDP